MKGIINMHKILIVDDEPLARIGIQTMLNLIDNVEVIGSAPNGQVALVLIEQKTPDIVITDIKMPVMNGIELMEYIYKNVDVKPVFVVLSSYDEFEYVRAAIRYEACYYLMKMELDLTNLTLVLDKAFEILERRSKQYAAETHLQAENIFINRFYFNLLNYAFNNEEDILKTSSNYNQKLNASIYVTIAAHIDTVLFSKIDQRYNLYLSVMNTAKTAISMYMNCHLVAWSQDTIGIILMLNDRAEIKELCETALLEANKLLHQYFNVSLTYGIGKTAENLMSLSDSFKSAIAALPSDNSKTNINQLIYHYDDHAQKSDTAVCKADIEIQKINHRLIRSFEICDVKLFTNTIDDLSRTIDKVNTYTSINLISNILHVIINYLDEGENVLAEAFADFPQSYQTLFTCKTPAEIHSYLAYLNKYVIKKMEEQINNSKYKIVLAAKAYIQDNIYDWLTLSKVASSIGISPNYLSTLFSTYSNLGFNDYITYLKMKKAQELLSKGNLKIYQVSEMLGFNNPHYFSKVYKKITGCSPSETPYTRK